MEQQKRRGRPPEGLESSLTVRLSPEQSAYLDRRSEQEDRPVSQIVRRIVAEEMVRRPLGEPT